MASFVLPDNRNRSSTALDGKSDMRDENLYSSLVVTHGGSGQQKIFTVPQGQTIPQMKGSSINATTNAHQLTYSDLTTNLTKAGEFGSGIGDVAVRNVGLTLEQAGYTLSSGAQAAFGAGAQEVPDVIAKTHFKLTIAGKDQIQGPMFTFPAGGGVWGSVSTSGNAATVAFAQNGAGTGSRKLAIPILIARNDTVQGTVSTGNSAAYAFSVTSGAGQPCLLWCTLKCHVRGDVR